MLDAGDQLTVARDELELPLHHGRWWGTLPHFHFEQHASNDERAEHHGGARIEDKGAESGS